MEIAITVDRTNTGDNSGTVGVKVGVSDVDAVTPAVGAGDCVGEEAVGLAGGFDVGSEVEEAKFANVLRACFGFPSLS